MYVIDTPEQISLFRIAALKSALELEEKGLKGSWGSALVAARRILGVDFPKSAKGRRRAIEMCEFILNDKEQ